ncbi:MAG: peptidylprolyl isomerase [Candidatus Cloacimonetes bacterium]|nr:peptidylprolyl isomerase [Candidatus Cloacimonadota bacterium]
MLEDLRKKQKGIIWAMAILFVLGMVIMGVIEMFEPDPYVGTIYGKKINLYEFDAELIANSNTLRVQEPDLINNDETRRRILDETWNQIVNRTVLDRQYKRYRIRVTRKDIEHSIFVDPPEAVRGIPSLQVNGVFDFNTYMSVLAENEQFANSLENWLKQTLPFQKLERKIKDQVVVTEDSVRVDWLERNDRISARVIFFDWNSVEAQEISDEDILAHYNRNRNDYRIEARRRYRVVSLPLEPSPADHARVQEEMNFIHGMLLEGADFGDMAELYSQDPGSAANRGTLGFFGRGRMVAEFENIAFNSEIGDLSEPFQSQFGWHIMLVTDKRENEQGDPEVEASHILIRVEASDRTRNDLRIQGDLLYERAGDIGLEKAAEEMNFEIRETQDFFRDADFIPGLGRYPHLVTEAFSRRLGYLIEPIETQEGTVMVAELSHREAAHIQDLEQVTEVIRRELDRERRTALAMEQANEFLREHSDEERLEIAEETGLRILDLTNRLITQTIPGLGMDRELNDELFKYNTDEWTSVINTDRGSFIGFITERHHPDMEDFYNNLESLTAELRERREQTHFNEWYQRIMDEANVQDFRYLHYPFF